VPLSEPGGLCRLPKIKYPTKKTSTAAAKTTPIGSKPSGIIASSCLKSCNKLKELARPNRVGRRAEASPAKPVSSVTPDHSFRQCCFLHPIYKLGLALAAFFAKLSRFPQFPPLQPDLNPTVHQHRWPPFSNKN